MAIIRKTIVLSACFFLFGLSCAIAESDYQLRRAGAKQKCEAISPSEPQSGLLFNPDGYRSFYVQSQCFQEAAVQFRDSSLCEKVRRRWSLFSSSWGISSTQCMKLVSDGVAKDRAELEKDKQLYLASPIRLKSVYVERNGNGLEFD